MWTPPERIKHALAEARWPTAEEAAGARLFSPIRLGPMTARRRTWVPAMVPWRATEDGFVTADVIDWYRRFARGRPGVLIVEATGIRDVASGPLLRIGHDRYIPGLRRLADAVREASDGETLLFIQIIDFLAIRRRPDREKFLSRFLAITDEHRRRFEAMTSAGASPGRGTGGPSKSDDRDDSDDSIRRALVSSSDSDLARVLSPRELESLRMGYRERVTDLHLPHIRDLPSVLPDLFAAAAARAIESGFHGVELHYAHAYTMASFLSPLNTRDDGYGGSREARIRLPLEVIAAVRKRSGSGVLGARMLGDEVIEGGGRSDDACWFACELARAGLDFLSISKGGKFEDAAQPKMGWPAYPYTGESGYECMPTVISDARGPFARNISLAAEIKKSLVQCGERAAVVAAGGINDFQQAERILQIGGADFVAAARQSLADPDWFEKIRTGRGREIRRCTYTNYCEALDQHHKQVTCKLWDRTALSEPGVPLDAAQHRRLIAPPWR